MANERIRRSERAKEMFLANTSHEIRTPMNAIIGLVELLKKTKLAKKQSEYLNIIEQSSENLLHILNDILDMSKIESEKMHLEYKAFNLMEVLNDSINTLMIKAKEKGLILELNCPKGCRDFVVLGDRVRLAQIIINLVNNAIKFTDRGKIQINIEQLEENKENFRFRFSVKDTGIGIAEERQKQVFQEFVQADDSTTRLYGGTGLGLSISQHLVSLMGGKLALKSKLGEGSEFFFTLQLEKADKKPIQELPRSAKPMDLEKNLVAGKKVLLVEDNAFNRLVAGKMLKELGLEYQEAENGREAIQKLKAHSFDLVLMDIQMPVMDGITATRSIRDEMEKPLSEIPIIALTAHALKGDREKYKAMGMTDYISKPYRMTQLRDILQKVLANTATASDLDTSQSEEPAKNFDLSQIEEIANGDLHFVAQMIETFTEPSIQTLNKLKHLLKEAQFSEIKKKLHAIKPGFGMFGRDDLVEQVAHLEKLCESDQTEQIQEKLNQFESEMRPLFEALKLKANRLKSKT
jgi:CheY-like chemotaxis protein/HPt (histidine-containing phosphotransfer) domain-containing protein/two-component sensor histidine kinase